MPARRTGGAVAVLLAASLFAGCGGSPVPGSGGSLRVPHDGWRIYRADLNPSGTELAVFGDPPGGTATWGVAVATLPPAGLRRVGPPDRFLSDAAWADDLTLVVTVGTVDEQQLALLTVRDGRLRALSTGQPFKHDYTEGMAVSPDGHQVAITLSELTTTTPSTEIVLMDLSSGASRTVIPMSQRRPRMPAWASADRLLYVEDNESGSTLETLSLASGQSAPLSTLGYRLHDIAADNGVLAFDGLDPSGNQGLFVSSLARFAPEPVEQGSYSMPLLRIRANIVAAVATGHSPADAGDVVVDHVRATSGSSSR